jgi:hypothetical protein
MDEFPSEYPAGHPAEYPTTPDANLPALPPARRAAAPRTPRWLLTGGLGLAFALARGIGVLIGSTVLPTFANANFAAVPHRGAQGGFGQVGPGAALNGPGHGPGRELTVTGVAADSITATATNRSGATTNVTIKTSASTQYARLGKTVDRGTITAGTKIAVRGTRNSDGSITATRVSIVVPGLGGTVSAVNGNDITVTGRDNATHVIHTDANTSFVRGDAASSLSAVTNGERIQAAGTLNSDGSLKAEVVHIALAGAGGQITTIDGTTVTVTTRRGTATIKVSGSTTYKIVTVGTNGPTEAVGSASDLAVGKYILAQGTKNRDGSLNAETVRIVPTPAAHGPGHGPRWGGGHGTPPATPGT